jgi:hypothetical protein
MLQRTDAEGKSDAQKQLSAVSYQQSAACYQLLSAVNGQLQPEELDLLPTRGRQITELLDRLSNSPFGSRQENGACRPASNALGSELSTNR